MNSWLTSRQQEAVDKLVKAGGRGIAWWKIGEGKTRIALDVFVQGVLTREGCGDKKLLVICSPQAFRQWEDEIALHPMQGYMFVEFLSYGLMSTARGRYWAEFYANDREIGMVVIDELWMFKNPHSARTKNVYKISRRHPTVGLSGSMITNRNIEDIYGQAYAVGIGQSIGRSLTDFRTQFCIAYEEFGLKFAAKKEALQTIQQRLAPFVDIHFPKDVRESRYQYITVDPTKEQLRLFDTCQNDYYTEFKDGSELEVKNAAVLLSKLLQISDGAVLNSEREIVSVQSNKFRRLLQLLEEHNDAGERVVVWFAFKASLDMAYETLGTKATCLSSDKKFDSKGWKDGQYQFALCTIGSGASLNDFADTQRAIIYSSFFSHRSLQQALGRTNRTGSTHTVCYYYFLQTAMGIDNMIYTSLRITDDIEKATIQSSADIIKEYYANRNNKTK